MTDPTPTTGRRTVRVWGHLVPLIEERARDVGLPWPRFLNGLIERVFRAGKLADAAAGATLVWDLRDRAAVKLALATPALRAALLLQHGLADPAELVDRVVVEATGESPRASRRQWAVAAALGAARPFLTPAEAEALAHALDGAWSSLDAAEAARKAAPVVDDAGQAALPLGAS